MIYITETEKTFKIAGADVKLTLKIPARLFLEAMDPYLEESKRKDAMFAMLKKQIVGDLPDEVDLISLFKFMKSEEYKAFLASLSQMI